MSHPLVSQIVEAVLYEGFILYPYRPSARKNRQRFTFGRVYPHAYCVAQNGAEPSAMRTQCLVVSKGEGNRLEVSIRFLHVVSREILSLCEHMTDLPSSLAPGLAEVVSELQVEGQSFLTWQEAVEREISPSPRDPRRICQAACRFPFELPASENLEAIRNRDGSIAGIIRRRQARLLGEILVQAEELRPDLFKISVDVVNQTPVPVSGLENQEAVLLRTFASTHTILHVEDGEFVSLMDPPDSFRELAASCKNEGTWPVLVGDEAAGDRTTVLSSPIILYDYPRIAAESPGEFLDGTEIDEILTLRVMTMTEAEKEEMRQSDPRARRILERTESLPEDQLLKLHGVLRKRRPFGDDPFGDDLFSSDRRLEVAEVSGVQLRVGSRVKIRPQSRADIMDIALEGKIATLEAIEEDAEGRIHLALVLDDDPGKDLGFMRQPGHRFFYTLDEVEPV
jgi:hydrogenase maturation protease